MGAFQKGIVRKKTSGHLSAFRVLCPFFLVFGPPSECTKRSILGKDISEKNPCGLNFDAPKLWNSGVWQTFKWSGKEPPRLKCSMPGFQKDVGNQALIGRPLLSKGNPYFWGGGYVTGGDRLTSYKWLIFHHCR